MPSFSSHRRPQVVQGIYSGVTTWELDTLAAETCAYMNTEHPHYARLAARISVSNLQRATSPSFAETVEELHAYVDPKTGRQAGYISDEVRGGGGGTFRSSGLCGNPHTFAVEALTVCCSCFLSTSRKEVVCTDAYGFMYAP